MTQNGFSTGLFDCFNDCGICIYTMCCPYCAMADNWAQSRNEDCSICHFLAFVFPIWTRDNIRVRLGQHEKQYVNDFLVYNFCTLCAISQDARELKRLRSATYVQEPLINQGNNANDHIVASQNYYVPPVDPNYQQPIVQQQVVQQQVVQQPPYVVQPGYSAPLPVFQDPGYPQQPPQ